MIRLREIRELKGLTQVELASLSGVAQTTISGVERGFNTTIGLLEQLADALDCDVRDLFAGGTDGELATLRTDR